MEYSAIKNNEFMKFLVKWMEIDYIILSEIPSQKEHTWYVLTDKWILTQKFRIPKKLFTDLMKLKNKEDLSVGASVLLRKETKYSRE